MKLALLDVFFTGYSKAAEKLSQASYQFIETVITDMDEE